MQSSLAVFIFRRDYRIHDNLGLIYSLKNYDKVLPCFIFDKEQLDNNKFKSDNCVQFMIESLRELDKELRKKGSKLFCWHGSLEITVKSIIKNIDPDAICFNKDYTPYSMKRDTSIKKLCKMNDIKLIKTNDYLLNEPETIFTGSGKPYMKFTPFMKTSKKKKIDKPIKNNMSNYVSSKKSYPKQFALKDADKFYKKNSDNFAKGGRSNAQAIIRGLKKLKNYNKTRNTPSKPTTGLSAHLRFGTVSIREAYWSMRNKLGARTVLLTQLYWRDFYVHLGYHFPQTYKHKSINDSKVNNVKWNNNSSWFKKWKEGKTGYPIVDAGMRQMARTGWMHNRVRMIVATFLIKDLLIDWKKGEQWFAVSLVDYCRSQNIGNWSWVAGINPTSQQWFRVFNPWTQSKKFDPDAEYIKTWVPELKDVPADDIHKWYDAHNTIYACAKAYPKPMVNHDTQRDKYLREVRKKTR